MLANGDVHTPSADLAFFFPVEDLTLKGYRDAITAIEDGLFDTEEPAALPGTLLTGNALLAGLLLLIVLARYASRRPRSTERTVALNR